ncbi:sulfur carrier protein [Bryocella elongata]|uniref:Sulfur carrier protein n=1 Tax=Bryocella elongata TaxID=863522 RepID=A0A1H5TYJ0_9BACT|nr:sulfur carrier protein ThiS [Bryocella elongata]SEF67238.1 sulfur carrier protein [Bryocella elongata]
MALDLQVNGVLRHFADLQPPVTLDIVVADLGLQAGRVAVEHNGDIVPRSIWETRNVSNLDKLEVVHFVGGGTL